MDMFCRQCEQAAGSSACTAYGVCGKDPKTAVLQDLLVYALKAISVYAKMLRDLGVKDKEADLFTVEGLFITVTNVSFDSEKIKEDILRAYNIKERLRKLFLDTYRNKKGKDFKDVLPRVADWVPAFDLEGLIEQGRAIGIMSENNISEDVRSLRELLLYGLKGMAAYMDHAYILGKSDDEITSFLYKGLSLLADTSLSVEDLINLNMEFGKVNFKCLELLDSAHTERFGHPVPTKVSLGVKRGPAIVISGHDLLDLEELLKQTQGRGINIYTHGEMLPAYGYPALNKYKHLVGHYGGAWQNQQKEFDEFPGAILMTTNCIQKPKDSYKDRIFTTGVVSWPQVKHILGLGAKKDFTPVITKAISMGGFKEDISGKDILVGFAHNAVLGVADKVVTAVKKGAIRHFFLIGGCDGAKPGRNYYTEFAREVPQDCVILTLACGKFRFNKMDFGDIAGIPRLLDCGQCNDAYSAIKIATALASAFGCSVNELPLSIVLSWYEQKAVCILLTLLSLGVKNIRIGPTLPAFVSPNVLKVLVDKFAVKPIGTASEDLKEILGEKIKV